MLTLLKDPFFQAFDDLINSSKFKFIPQINVQKNDTEYIVSVCVPGLTKDDLKITIKDNVLNILYQKETDTQNNYFIGSFTKTYKLPDDVKEKDIEGKVENGILTITLPLHKRKPSERFISLN
jgi:HSP20 family protein